MSNWFLKTGTERDIAMDAVNLFQYFTTRTENAALFRVENELRNWSALVQVRIAMCFLI